MQRKKYKKRSITLIEILVVMSLIAIITGALAYNYQGAIEKGKAFKTEETIKRMETILSIELSEKSDEIDDIKNHWQQRVIKSPMWGGAKKTKDGQDITEIFDGWGGKISMKFERNPDTGELEIIGKSVRLEEYKKKHG